VKYPTYDHPVKVRDPRGQIWRITRRWVPWRRRLKGAFDAGPDMPMGLGDDPVSLIVGAFFLIIMLPFLVLMAIASLELLLVLLVLPFAVLGRVLFGRRWTVEVRRGWKPVHEELTGTWNDASVRITELSVEIERGQAPAPTLTE
jgi:hypothetical protein